MRTPSGKPGIPSIFRLTSPEGRANGSPRHHIPPRTKLIRFVRLTHQSERTSLLARSGNLSKVATIRFGPLTRR